VLTSKSWFLEGWRGKNSHCTRSSDLEGPTAHKQLIILKINESTVIMSVTYFTNFANNSLLDNVFCIPLPMLKVLFLFQLLNAKKDGRICALSLFET
jgi:hypothetical protein